MRRRRPWLQDGRLCATCGILMAGRAPEVMTCSQTCTLAWLHRAIHLVPHSRTGEPFILGLTDKEALELSSLDVLVDDGRLRELQQKHSDAIDKGGPVARAFVERAAMSSDRFH